MVELLLYLIAFILIIYLISRLIQNMKSKSNNTIEGLSLTKDSTDNAMKEFSQIKAKYNNLGSVQSLKKEFANMPLHDYSIMSSYNSARSGDYVTSDMVKHVLSRGCRFLDFEIFYVKEGKNYIPKVGFTTDRSYSILDSKNTVSLDEILSGIAGYAFSQSSPNHNDPVFINLRIKSKDTNIYQAVAKSIDANIKNMCHVGKINKDTKMVELLRKIVIVMDKTIERDYPMYSSCPENNTKCYELTKYINIESGSEYLNLFTYTGILNHSNTTVLIKDNNIETTATHMKMAVPDLATKSKNPEFKDFILKHACQNVLYRFDIYDKNIKKYEEYFQTANGGIVPLSAFLKILTQK